MPECKICGETDVETYKCKKCGTLFCEYCGSAEGKLCLDCIEEEEYEEGDEEEGYEEEYFEEEVCFSETSPKPQRPFINIKK